MTPFFSLIFFFCTGNYRPAIFSDKFLLIWKPKNGFLTKIWIFDQNLDFWLKFGFLAKIWIFG